MENFRWIIVCTTVLMNFTFWFGFSFICWNSIFERVLVVVVVAFFLDVVRYIYRYYITMICHNHWLLPYTTQNTHIVHMMKIIFCFIFLFSIPKHDTQRILMVINGWLNKSWMIVFTHTFVIIMNKTAHTLYLFSFLNIILYVCFVFSFQFIR